MGTNSRDAHVAQPVSSEGAAHFPHWSLHLACRLRSVRRARLAACTHACGALRPPVHTAVAAVPSARTQALSAPLAARKPTAQRTVQSCFQGPTVPQKRVDIEVDRWARAKDLPAMSRTLGHIIDGAPAIQTDGSDVRKAMLKALRIVHPDKIDPNASAAYKAKAQRVFTTLQAAHKQ